MRLPITLLQKIRSFGLKAELYPENSKMKKQMAYADKRNIPFVVIIGESEVQKRSFVLKNMKTGTQSEYFIDDVSEEMFK